MNVLVAASWGLAAAAIVIGFFALATFRQPLLALRVMLELFIAAGLLRLSVDASWTAITGTVVVIALRRVITRSLTVDLTPARPAP
ncbi:hypothetical protein [Mycobacterium sp. SMC-4]|uniref:hypothetical protein n=1 Tax=Mycobacterium sp. SMC-4 TaxID=2857059 RepID=UPI0021B1849C|nr:hypothetical protein [Mycobacterium sp. SMC-4]UXA19973.1 hypothetical protein KXD98_10480 [Mycobacterium sp. SMC-4]